MRNIYIKYLHHTGSINNSGLLKWADNLYVENLRVIDRPSSVVALTKFI
ncbi:hypothetical protein GCM10028818_09700 [Spirosoma horti]